MPDVERILENARALLEDFTKPRPSFAHPAEMAGTLTSGRFHRPPHLDLISQRIAEACRREERLIVTSPVRHGKSTLCSQWTPFWYLQRHPDRTVILASYADDFAGLWGKRIRSLVEEYGPKVGLRLSADTTSAARWETVAGGGLHACGVGGQLVGKGAHLAILDDVTRDKESHSATERENAIEWWQGTMRTRLEPGAAAIVLQARVHTWDLPGFLLDEAKKGGEQWDELRLAAVSEGDGDPLGRPLGAALWPERYDAEALETIRIAVGPYVWNSQYQQRPVPDGGAVFLADWFKKTWAEIPRGARFVQSWDCAFKATSTSDYVVGQVWAKNGADFYLVDQVRRRLDFPGTVEAIRALSAKWPQASAKFVEDKANGSAIIDFLRREISGLIPVQPSGGKIARAQSVAPFWQAGNVHLPDSKSAPWVGDFISEHLAFPHGRHDDAVDAGAQALLQLSRVAQAKTFHWSI